MRTRITRNNKLIQQIYAYKINVQKPVVNNKLEEKEIR